jgi:hypothetical protein
VTCTLADGSKLLDERGDGFVYQGTVRMHHCHICTGTRARARPCHICTGTRARPCHICTGTGLTLPHLHRDLAHPCHICTGTRAHAATSAPGLGSPPCSESPFCGRGAAARACGAVLAAFRPGWMPQVMLLRVAASIWLQECASAPKPATTEQCALPTWGYDEWSRCSVTCGDGVKTRSV